MLGAEIECLLQACQHAETEQIDLENTEIFQIVLIPLDNSAIFHRRVLHRHHVMQLLARDDEAADMLRQVPRKALQRVRQLNALHQPFIARIEPLLLQVLLFDAARPPMQHLGQIADLILGIAERLRHFANSTASAIADQRRRQPSAIAAILLVNVLNDFFTPLVLEIDIDIRRLAAFFGNEAFK